MDTKDADKVIWPAVVGLNDELWLGIEDSGLVKYLVFDSYDKKSMYIRSAGAWFRVPQDNNTMALNNLTIVDVTPSIIAVYDEKEKSMSDFTYQDLVNYASASTARTRQQV